MCRLFGFRSVIPSQVHRSLMDADNALGVQSVAHPDGWGVAYYVDGAPHITRSAATAVHDGLFHRVSGVVSSETVLAHVRKATVGSLSVLNCHPFQYGRWTFAHNGDIPHFETHREALLAQVAPALRRFVLGETDSEVIFFLLLTHLEKQRSLRDAFTAEQVASALQTTVREVRARADRPDSDQKALLTLLVTNGSVMAAVQGGKELFWSTYKTRCADRDVCPSLGPACEAPSETGFVNHLILSSEPLSGENVWNAMDVDEVVAADSQMRLVRLHPDRRKLQVLAG